MDSRKYMLLVNGQDKTDSVASFRFQNGMCEVIYTNSPKAYHYRAEKVQLLKVESRINPSDFIITVDGDIIQQVDEILDFGPFYRFLRTGKKALTYPKGQVELQKNCLKNQKQAGVFEYFKETAAAVSLVAEGGLNILSAQYERIKSVSDVTVLSYYLDSSKKPTVRALPEAVIYPFGLNQSQKTAVENALSSQVSIIQGPPGTGKTQTILNIISNAVRNGQTVAVVSNNNSATLNVAEKLEKKGLSFLTAFLGSRANKEHFQETQTGQYPDMSAWVLEAEEKSQLDQEVTVLSREISEMLNGKNRIAAIEQELLQLTPEQHYFGEYYSTYTQAPRDEVKGLSAQKILSLWLEYEQHAQQENKLSLLQKISILFRFNRSALKVFLQTPELVIPYLQRQFYVVRRQELTEERAQLEKKLEQYAFDEKMEELTEKSLRLFQAELSEKFHWKEPRQRFEMRDFRGKSKEFNQEYPVILSTTYSIKGTLNFEHTYDYLIVDEASQVDLATGVLAFASARNIVIVGDLQQLPKEGGGDRVLRHDVVDHDREPHPVGYFPVKVVISLVVRAEHVIGDGGDHQRVGARLLRREPGADGGGGAVADDARDHRNLRILRADEADELRQLAVGEGRALSGAAARADPVHARVQEAADLPLGARGIEPPRLVKGGDQRRDNPFDCLDHATASFAIR